MKFHAEKLTELIFQREKTKIASIETILRIQVVFVLQKDCR
jgi:hypothetical protein